MNEGRKIDFSRLLGFEVMSEELAQRVDFKDEIFTGRLGAKVGFKNHMAETHREPRHKATNVGRG